MNTLKKLLSQKLVFSRFTSIVYSIYQSLISLPFRFKNNIFNHIPIGVKVIGWRSISFEGNVVLSSGTFVNINSRGKSIRLRIGKNSFIGLNNFLSIGNTIDIGPYFLSASNCSLIGSSHIITDPFTPYMSTGTINDIDIKIGTNYFCGAGSSIIGNVNIGHGTIIGANCVVFNNIPPFSIVIGNPGVVIKRFDFKNRQWTKCFDELSYFPSEDDYLNILEENLNGDYPFMPLNVSNTFFTDMP